MAASDDTQAFTATAQHIRLFSALIAADPEIMDLNMRHLQLLALICLHTKPVSVGALATEIAMQPYVTSRLLDRLHEHGLIDRVEAEDDRRRKEITATAAGQVLEARVLAFFDAAKTPSSAAA